MGMVVAGQWRPRHDAIEDGAFRRETAVYGDPLTDDIRAAMARDGGRFHLIASRSCPWSHRVLIVRALKRLDEILPVQIAGGPRVEGYAVDRGAAWPVPGTSETVVHLHDLYRLGNPRYTGRATVPALWDTRARRIVSNESARLTRALDRIVAPGGDGDFTLVPKSLEPEIDAFNAWLDRDLCNAVYRAGLAQLQPAYDDAVAAVFSALDRLEVRLAYRRYLFGAVITEPDWRLFATLVRFDAVYHTHFRCTRRRLVDYPHLWNYARDLHGWRGVAETVDIAEIREGYYLNDGDHNPHDIVAAPPDMDWTAPHDRAEFGPAHVMARSGLIVAVDPATLAWIEEAKPWRP